VGPVVIAGIAVATLLAVVLVFADRLGRLGDQGRERATLAGRRLADRRQGRQPEPRPRARRSR